MYTMIHNILKLLKPRNTFKEKYINASARDFGPYLKYIKLFFKHACATISIGIIGIQFGLDNSSRPTPAISVCVQAMKAEANLRISAGSSEHSLFAFMKSTPNP